MQRDGIPAETDTFAPVRMSRGRLRQLAGRAASAQEFGPKSEVEEFERSIILEQLGDVLGASSTL